MIKKYQAGGIYYTPFIRPSAVQETAKSPSNKESDKRAEQLQKSILEVLKQNGLPNDVDFFLSAANSFLYEYSSPLSQLSDSILGYSNNNNQTIGQLIKLQSLANRVKHNNDLYENAQKEINTTGSGADIALTSHGEMYVLNNEDGTLQTISPKLYSENKDKCRVLTNSELLHYRANAQKLTFNDNILEDLKDITSMGAVIEFVNKQIDAFGKEEYSSDRDQFVTKHQDQISKGLEILGDAPKGLYKVHTNKTKEYEGYDQQDEESIKYALKYLYKSLPPGMKNVLIANTAAEGLDPTNGNDVTKLLQSALVLNTDHKYTDDITISYAGDLDRGSGNKTGNTKQVVETFGDIVFSNKGDLRTNTMVLGENIQFNIPTRFYNVRNFDNEAMPNINTAIEVDQNLRDWGLRDTRNQAYFGNVPINDMSVVGNSIIVDYERGMGVAPLPVNENGDIDFSMLTLMNNIQKDINKKRITSDIEKAKIWEAAGFVYNPQMGVGCPRGGRLKMFAMQNAYVTSKSGLDNKALKTSAFVENVDNDIIEGLENTYNLQHKDEKSTLKLDIDYNTFSSLWNNSYKGILYIPLTQNVAQSSIASQNAYIDRRDTYELKGKQDFINQSGGYDPNSGVMKPINLDDLN